MKKMRNSTRTRHKSAGFTLVEVLISMVVASILILAIYGSYIIQQKAYTVQRDLARMENCLRAAMQIIRSDLLNTGRNEALDGSLGIMESRRYNQWNPGTLDATANGFEGITLTTGMDPWDLASGTPPDSRADPGVTQTISYRLIDTDGSGRRKLYRIDSNYPAGAATDPAVPGGVLICDCIDDIGFAYAVDRNHDEEIDRFNVPPLNSIIWAVDANNDGRLETNLDGNGSGTITPDDAGGMNLGTTVPFSDVRAVSIWLLARSTRPDTNYHDGKVYQVGLKTIDPDTDNTAAFRRMLLSSTVTLRNRERKP